MPVTDLPRQTYEGMRQAGASLVGALSWAGGRTPAHPAEYDRCEAMNHKEVEQAMILQYLRVQTATLLRPTAGCSGSVEDFMRQRVAQILQKNPWLTGEIRLVDKKYALTWRDVDANVDVSEYFCVTRGGCEGLGAKMGAVADIVTSAAKAQPPSYTDITRDGEQYGVPHKQGYTGKPLFHLRLVDVTEGDDSSKSYVLILSTNHGVTDGATFYMLYRMLSADAEVIALDPARELIQGDPISRRWLPRGAPIENWLGLNLRVSFSLFVNSLSWLLTPPRSHGVYVLDMEEVERRKAEAAKTGEVKFVSSNDVITSWWWKKWPATLSQCGMAINLRGKAEGVHDTKAGNYFTTMMLDPRVDDLSPQGIRKVLANGNTTPLQHTGLLKKYTDPPLYTTSWRTFHKPITTPTHSEAVHMPLRGETHCGAACTLFNVGENRVAAYLDKCPFDSKVLDLSEDPMVLRQVMLP
eukprot:TRINITY_DN2238_c0_g1_i10.p1 TRINITY_DN2238_c0_g1~~TRINITY_DN2238_c0_g1_i10.p1  ORF type:complete len:467 (+),score=196.00 TRINITY_DN2238_c0_g1_i10:76-1476(+)